MKSLSLSTHEFKLCGNAQWVCLNVKLAQPYLPRKFWSSITKWTDELTGHIIRHNGIVKTVIEGYVEGTTMVIVNTPHYKWCQMWRLYRNEESTGNGKLLTNLWIDNKRRRYKKWKNSRRELELVIKVLFIYTVAQNCFCSTNFLNKSYGIHHCCTRTNNTFTFQTIT